MEALISQFTFLSDQALTDKNFDPSTIEDLMRLFEVESYNAWAAIELQQQRELEAAEESLREAEDYLDREMERAMDEMRKMEEEMERIEREEVKSLLEKAEDARRMGIFVENAATIAAKRYIETALNAASASMRSAWKAASGNKVHPS